MGFEASPYTTEALEQLAELKLEVPQSEKADTEIPFNLKTLPVQKKDRTHVIQDPPRPKLEMPIDSAEEHDKKVAGIERALKKHGKMDPELITKLVELDEGPNYKSTYPSKLEPEI